MSLNKRIVQVNVKYTDCVAPCDNLGSEVVFWSGEAIDLQIRVTDGSSSIDMEGVSTFYVEFKEGSTGSPPTQATSILTSGSASLTSATVRDQDWEAKTDYHAVISLSDSAMNMLGTKWLGVYADTAAGNRVMLAAGQVTFKDPAVLTAGAPTSTSTGYIVDTLTTKGDVLVHDGTDYVRLAAGADTYVLTADSTQASGVTWAAGGGGGGGRAVELATSTVSASTASVSFTSFAGTYDRYLLTVSELKIDTDGQGVYLQVSTDNGSTWDTTTANYDTRFNIVNNTVGSYVGSQPAWVVCAGVVSNQMSNNSAASGSFEAILSGMNDSALYTLVDCHANYLMQGATEHRSGNWSGVYKITTVVNGLKLYMTSGNFTSGVFTLYGLDK